MFVTLITSIGGRSKGVWSANMSLLYMSTSAWGYAETTLFFDITTVYYVAKLYAPSLYMLLLYCVA